MILWALRRLKALRGLKERRKVRHKVRHKVRRKRAPLPSVIERVMSGR
jgi:hypothetical protein